MFDVEQQLKWAERADDIVAEAAQQEGVVVPEILANAIAGAVRVSNLSQAGVFSIVAAYAGSERQAGRLPMKEFQDWNMKD